MKKDRLRLYLLEFMLLLILTLALFVSNIFNRKILALFLSIISFVTLIVIKKKNVISYYKNQVAIMMTILALIYLGIFYLMGLYFGYYLSTVRFGASALINYIIPFTLIIVSSELIRKKLIIQKGKLSKFIVFLCMVIIDLLVYIGVYDVFQLEDLLTVIGFILFASIANNLLYNYITIRYGGKGVIIYRLITVLYVYFIPYVPNVYIFFRSFLRMLYPYIIYLLLEYTFTPSSYAVEYKDRKKSIIGTSVVFTLLMLLIALISCRFKYGIIVIGSGSMTGTINKGDAIIYKKYNDDEIIKVGTVIIFDVDDVQTIHRVVKVENVNGKYRYYTKGDFNKNIDDGYIMKDNIIGTSKIRIQYIGWPSIWIRDVFNLN